MFAYGLAETKFGCDLLIIKWAMGIWGIVIPSSCLLCMLEISLNKLIF